MHVPDHVMDPATCVATTAISVAAVGYAGYRVYRDLPREKRSLLGVVAAGVFAAQMVNFPISGSTSGHVVGAVLAAILLGPWAGLLAVTAVLAVQCVLFQDGGVTALGANVLNMGVVGSLLGYAIYERLQTAIDGRRGKLLAAAFASWFSVLIGAALCSVELTLGGEASLANTLGAMLPSHALIGIGEAAIAAAAVATALWWRPVFQPSRAVAVGAVLAVAVVLLAAPLASTLPDGLESSLSALGYGEPAALWSTPLADYSIAGVPSAALQTMVAGMIGIAAVLGLSSSLAGVAMPRKQEPRSGGVM
ncbi:energy-coupling factor ABC transporter permease [Roseimaritima ulvae]|uniref:Fused nickel transport protein NikMN n=1 Tax=Roseimaritima ulvae TaxID=980254 RepID=A0A5B9QPD4_9BACT|nr:energy-coupling factor ABC transporter permease [Roseimaritima ulvae]QEG39530.1 Fused nickel transport protein NikMN [Roseimaritima ulvae]